MVAGKTKKIVAGAVPDYLKEYITRSTVAMENISRYIEQQNIVWPQLIDTLNSDFLVHNTKTEQLVESITKSTKDICGSVDKSIKSTENFQKDVWNKTWKLIERILITAVGVISAIAGFRILTGGIP